ncbi:dTMP kinase [Streptomyces sp. R39]|uniref:dTMP kinase n=1 Tax=Streptomyces sp. R39 TaxID=3238631 RepID=A0AB39QFC3_9ACTN
MDSATRGLFIVLLGIDGSGKTSLLSALRGGTFATVGWRDLRNHELPAVMAPDAPSAIKDRLSDLPRAMFVGGHIVAQYEYLVRPEVVEGRNVLLDSYWYKVLAKERALGRLSPALEDLRQLLPVPDAVVLLDVDPRTAWARRGGTCAPYERFDDPGGQAAGFVRFQECLLAQWEADLRGHPAVYRLDGERPFDEVLTSLRDTLELCAVPRLPELEALS